MIQEIILENSVTSRIARVVIKSYPEGVHDDNGYHSLS